MRSEYADSWDKAISINNSLKQMLEYRITEDTEKTELGITHVQTDIREYNENMPVNIIMGDNGRLVIETSNECGWNSTRIDLIDTYNFLKGMLK